VTGTNSGVMLWTARESSDERVIAWTGPSDVVFDYITRLDVDLRASAITQQDSSQPWTVHQSGRNPLRRVHRRDESIVSRNLVEINLSTVKVWSHRVRCVDALRCNTSGVNDPLVIR